MPRVQSESRRTPRVSIAVVVEAAGFLEDAGKFDAARAHVFDVGVGAGVAVLEVKKKPARLRSGFGPLAPEDLVVAVAVEGRVDVDQVHAGVGELAQLVEAVAAVDDAGVEQGGRTNPPGSPLGTGEAGTATPLDPSFLRGEDCLPSPRPSDPPFSVGSSDPWRGEGEASLGVERFRGIGIGAE